MEDKILGRKVDMAICSIDNVNQRGERMRYHIVVISDPKTGEQVTNKFDMTEDGYREMKDWIGTVASDFVLQNEVDMIEEV